MIDGEKIGAAQENFALRQFEFADFKIAQCIVNFKFPELEIVSVLCPYRAV